MFAVKLLQYTESIQNTHASRHTSKYWLFISTTRTKHAEKNFLLLLPNSSQLTISLVSIRLKTVDALNTCHNCYIKIITIKPTMKSNTRTLKSLPQIHFHHKIRNSLI